MEKLVRVLSDLRCDGRNIILVTSGAIGVGRFRMGMSEKPNSLPQKQALAAIGQVSLMHMYSKFLVNTIKLRSSTNNPMLWMIL